MTGLWQDVRFAWRMLMKNPGFTAVVVLAIGLGIGVNSSIFTIVRGILLRDLPFEDPSRLVAVENFATKSGSGHPFGMSMLDYVDIRDRVKSLRSMSAFAGSMAYLTLGTEPERFTCEVITPGLFETLGIKPMLGRTFLPEEGVYGKQFTSVIISHRIWKNRLASDPKIIGRVFRMNGRMRTVVGVMPENFRFPETTDFWV